MRHAPFPILAILVFSMPSRAATIRVPGDKPTIQSGISASSAGDTVLVAPGTYFENVLIDRRVALLSEVGAELTTIDGQELAEVVFIQGNVDHAVIEGFRITHGNASAGGIYVDIGDTGGYAAIRHNIVEHNRSVGGAAIYSQEYSTVEDNLIQYNHCIKGTGAMEVWGKIERNIVRYNGGTGNLYNVLVRNTDTFAWNVVVDNQTGRDEVVFTGGGSIHNNTFVRDSPFYPTVAVWGGSPPYDFYNNVIVHGAGGGLDCHLVGSNTIRCNDVWGEGQSYMRNCAGLEGIDGNFSADPLFCDAPNGDYRLTAASPCAPGNAPPGCGLIGALPVGCGVADVAGSATPVRPRLAVDPNPVLSAAEFSFSAEIGSAALEIYDLQGRLLQVLIPEHQRTIWLPDASVPRGIYFARLRGTAVPEVLKFAVIR